MQTLFAFGLLVLIAFLGSRFIRRGQNFLSPVSFFFLTGFLYIFFGVALGKRGFNVLNSHVLESLNPLISLGLGWIGFVFGFQLEYKYIKRFSWHYIGLSFLQFLFVMFFVLIVLLIVLLMLFPSQSRFLLIGMAVAFGLLLSLNAPTLMHAASSMLPNKGEYYYLARFLVSVSGFWGILGLALLTSFWRFPVFKSHVFVKGLGIFLGSTALPAFLGYLFYLITRKKVTNQDLLVYLLGVVFFISGTAFYFNLSPLYSCMVLGLVFSNLTRIQEKIYPLLLSTEKPVFITFLIMIGALWEFQSDFRVIVLVFLLVIVRVIGYVLPLRIQEKILRFPLALPMSFGFCFLSSGGMGIAFAVSLKLIYHLPLADIFLSVSLFSILISELLSPWGFKISIMKLDQEC